MKVKAQLDFGQITDLIKNRHRTKKFIEALT